MSGLKSLSQRVMQFAQSYLCGWCVELWQGEAAIQLKRLADQLIGCFAKTYDIARRAAAAVVSL